MLGVHSIPYKKDDLPQCRKDEFFFEDGEQKYIGNSEKLCSYFQLILCEVCNRIIKLLNIRVLIMSNTCIGFFNPIIPSKNIDSFTWKLGSYLETVCDFGFQKKYTIKVIQKDNESQRILKENVKDETSATAMLINAVIVLTVLPALALLALKACFRYWQFSSLYPQISTAEQIQSIANNLFEFPASHEGLTPVEEFLINTTIRYSLIEGEVKCIRENYDSSANPFEDENFERYLKILHDISQFKGMLVWDTEGVNEKAKLQFEFLKRKIEKIEKKLNEGLYSKNVLMEGLEAIQVKIGYERHAETSVRRTNIENYYQDNKDDLMYFRKQLSRAFWLGKLTHQEAQPLLEDLEFAWKSLLKKMRCQHLEAKERPSGIDNISNSCYMNSLLQVLLNTSHFKKSIQDAISPSTTERENLADRHLKEALLQFMEAWMGGISEDIREAAYNMRLAIYTSDAPDYMANRSNEANWSKERARQQDPITLFELIAGVLNYRFGRYQKFTPSDEKNFLGKVGREEPYRVLTVPVGQCIDKPMPFADSAQGLVDELFKPEPFSDASSVIPFKPKKGGEKASLTFSTRPYLKRDSLPPVMMVQINRAYSDWVRNVEGKFDTELPFPADDILDFSKALEEKAELKYKLTSFIEHIGETGSSGHYISWVNRKGTWFKCNDSQVREASEDEVNQAKARSYLFMMERVEN